MDASLRVTVQFQPDRVVEGHTVLEGLRRDGVYRSQFETGVSSGGLTAHPGGDRWSWESRLFGAAYDDAPPAARPRYGSLNYRRRPGGGSPRFGSAHLRLTGESLARTTFCYPDSVFQPTALGTAGRMSLVALADENVLDDPLDDYIEAHVHGPVKLAEDVEALVLDPCYRDTEVETVASRLRCQAEWHPGWRLDVAVLAAAPGYRGQQVVEAGLRVARDGVLDARAVGDGMRAGVEDEQVLKRVWHCIARFGTPVAPA